MNIPPSAMQPGENDDFVTDLDSQQRLRKSLELSQRIHVINSQRSIVSNVKCLDGTQLLPFPLLRGEFEKN
jgi:hypothetical protein